MCENFYVMLLQSSHGAGIQNERTDEQRDRQTRIWWDEMCFKSSLNRQKGQHWSNRPEHQRATDRHYAAIAGKETLCVPDKHSRDANMLQIYSRKTADCGEGPLAEQGASPAVMLWDGGILHRYPVKGSWATCPPSWLCQGTCPCKAIKCLQHVTFGSWELMLDVLAYFRRRRPVFTTPLWKE